MIDIDIIKDYKIFDSLSENQLDEVRRCLIEHSYGEGEMICEEGEEGNSLYLLLEGEVVITQALTLSLDNDWVDSREKSLIHIDASVKTFIGEVGLLEVNGKRTATVRCVKKSKTAELTRNDFNQLAEKDPLLGYRLIHNIGLVLCQRLRTTNTNLLKVTTAFSLALER